MPVYTLGYASFSMPWAITVCWYAHTAAQLSAGSLFLEAFSQQPQDPVMWLPPGRAAVSRILAEHSALIHSEWHSAEHPRAVLVLAPGAHQTIQLWTSKHTTLIPRLQALQVAVFLFEFRGFGLSSSPTPTLDYSTSYQLDVKAAVAHASSRYPGLPLILYGQGLGGLTAVLASSELPSLAAIILSSPVLKLPASTTIHTHVLGLLTPSWPMPSAPIRTLTDSAAFRECWVNSTTTPSLAAATVRAGIRAVVRARSVYHKIAVPCFVMSGPPCDAILEAPRCDVHNYGGAADLVVALRSERASLGVLGAPVNYQQFENRPHMLEFGPNQEAVDAAVEFVGQLIKRAA